MRTHGEKKPMSERAIAFVEKWVSEHVKPQAAALAQQCVQDAQAAGIPEAEIHDAFEDLVDYMAGEIEEANEREADSLAGEDGG
jgi:hypothetical protein